VKNYNKAFLLGLCFFCIVGIMVIVAFMLYRIINHENNIQIPYAGQVFTIFILVGLWSLKKLRKIYVMKPAKNWSVIKIIFATYGVSGIFYIIIFIFSLFCCGVEGTRFVAENMIVIILLGAVGSLYFVLKNLK